MKLLNDEQRAKYDMFKRVINLFNANPDWLRKEPKLIPPLAQLFESVARIDAIEAGVSDDDDDDDDWGGTDQELLTRAEAIAAIVTPYREQFVKAGLPENFLEDLREKIVEMRRAIAKLES